ncbi:hypothetical protein N7478_004798 [Penicillium angulare]|uniref:uncharacterized protein n=1 Tax=Penicillium angulare TaxID=116970 RepID=UPI0025403284|nr:uncharacterized protein N7478_004798 [Penicillium angulare]KAJ5279426.1 hypothetical protein N7478_004798 [Penicillium angulare]
MFNPKTFLAYSSPRENYPGLNDVSTQLLDIYVVGTNCYGELGLGSLTKKSELSRPVLNSKLDVLSTGVIYIAVGGVHSAALTHDNRILTWGVNDEGALGRDTKQDDNDDTQNGGNSSDEESDEDEVDLNLKEATPLPVDSSFFPSGTVFTQLAASDSATFGLTTEGLVYGWGTFRGENGGIGFSPKGKEEQRTPILIPAIKDIISIVAGAQHILALSSNGSVFGWGCDEQNQLGRRRATRHNAKSHHLIPDLCAVPSGIRTIGVGLYHSFAIHKTGTVYGWGSNNFGQTGVSSAAGLRDAIVAYPDKVPGLQTHGTITSVFGGKDHSIALTETGKCLVWGRIDNKALGIPLEEMSKSYVIYDEYGRPRILKEPYLLSGFGEDPVDFATAGSDHSFVITRSGKAYSWGFNTQSQAGQPGIDEVEKPTLVKSKYVDGKKLVAAAGGGQFSIIVGVSDHSRKKKSSKK